MTAPRDAVGPVSHPNRDAGTPLRVLFAIPHLARGGGAERVMLTLLQRLDRQRFAPGLLVLDASRNEIASELPADVPVIDLGITRVRYVWRPLTRALAAHRPDVLLSGLGHLNLMISMLRPLLPRRLAIVGRETSVVTSINAHYRTAALRNLAYRLFYRNLDLVICQSSDMQDDLVGRLGFPAARTRRVPNPVDVDRVRGLAAAGTDATPAAAGPEAPLATVDTAALSGASDPPQPPHPPRPLRLVAVGRLAPQKGFDLLCDAITRLPPGTAEVDVIGDGPERDALAARIADHGLADRVRLRGFDANPYAWMRRADAFVLSSRYEGMPNVVLESLAVGTPVIATPCPGGLAEIAATAGGVTLAESVSAEALAAAIRRFASRARADAVAEIDVGTYRAETVVAAYETILLEAAGLPGRARAR